MSYIKYTKPLKEEDARKQIEDAIKNNEGVIKMLPVVLPILKKWDGKSLNIRLAKQVKQALGEGYNVSCGPNLSWYELTVYGPAMNRPMYDEKYRFLLRYDDSSIFSWDWFEKNQLFWTVEKLQAENEKYKKLIGKLPALVRRWNKAIEELRAINKEVEDSPVSFAPFFDINK